MAKYAPLLKTANKMQQWLPPGLGARTLQQVTEQKPVAGFASLSMLGLWVVLAGGALAGRLKAQYRGQNLSWAPSRDKAIGRGGGWTLGGSGPFAAIVEKELRSLMRTVPLLWAVSVPALFVLVIAGVLYRSPSSEMNSFPYAFPLCVAYALLGFTGLFYNNLGAEGAGIQLLFLSPTPIRTVLLAKNLVHSILFALVGFAAGVLGWEFHRLWCWRIPVRGLFLRCRAIWPRESSFHSQCRTASIPAESRDRWERRRIRSQPC
jgi:ABC-2 type transport system permease protein